MFRKAFAEYVAIFQSLDYMLLKTCEYVDEKTKRELDQESLGVIEIHPPGHYSAVLILSHASISLNM